MAGEDGFTNGRGGGALQVEMAMEEGKMFSTSNRGGEKSFPSPAEQLKFPPTQPESDRLYNLAVNNLSYKVKIKVNKVAQDKILLNNVTARANHSEMLAVVGPSGSSKTTFLDAMAGRIDRRSLSGQILVNQSPMDATFKRVSGYVMQDDALFPHLTTRETLMFSARLRLPGSMSNQEKARRVDSLIQQLGLVECANTYVGDEKVRGVSGGERRRVSIGVDLIHDPSVLFLDEPTSGLDSTSALHVMQILSQMAVTHHRTVLLTIHQPSFRLLETINRILVLARGNVIYHGRISGMVDHFSGLGQTMPTYVNAVEYALDVIEDHQNQHEGLQHLVEYQKKSQGIKALEVRKSTTDEQTIIVSAAIYKPAFATSFLSETIVLGERNLINVFRTKELFFIRLCITTLVALTMATLFLHSKKSSEEGVQQREGYISFTLAFLIFTSTEALPVFLNERQIFIRETSRGAYRASSYAVSQSIVILPFLFVLAALYSLISYFAIGLVTNVGAYFFFVLILFLTLAVSNALVSFVATIVPDFSAGATLATAICAYFFLFAGFFILRTGIPKYWLWVHYLSIFKYPYEALLANEYNHLPGVIWYDNMDSDAILSSVALGKVHIWNNVVILIVFTLVYRLLFYTSLRFNTRNLRK
ncbi:hypothetical protein CY35_12G051800 [Sphagnum magellanicum]|nr:hypothetical protein CY35_12G051800 [Sphagnum magellanicum]